MFLLMFLYALLAQFPMALYALLAQFPGDIVIPEGTDFLFASILIGAGISPLISFLSSRSWSSQAKGAMAFLYCVIASVGLLLAANHFNAVPLDWRAWFSSFLIIFVLAVNLYRQFFQPAGFADKLEAAGPIK